MMLALLLLLMQAAGPRQPVPYSHKLHAGDLKLACSKCHTNPEPGDLMTYPKPEVCAECHKDKYGREIEWVPVYRIPSFVDFSHREHLKAGNTCEECHGPVAQREVIRRETDLSMGGCMECHRVKKAGIGCNYCHELRN
ncbi:MAG: cytochrome c3 family protein [Acidobacteriota bacterium]|nr:cytochrome c3 family protein [Acidobacteriota bacterium]